MESHKTCLTFVAFVEASTDHEKRVNNNDQNVEKCCLHMRQAVRNQVDWGAGQQVWCFLAGQQILYLLSIQGGKRNVTFRDDPV